MVCLHLDLHGLERFARMQFQQLVPVGSSIRQGTALRTPAVSHTARKLQRQRPIHFNNISMT
eukprot:4665278-Pleurochrysis_carterae.AAC.2